MNTFLQRNTLLASAAALSLLLSLFAPAAMADDGHNEHDHSATAPATQGASDTPAPKAQSNAPKAQQMDHGAMSHDGMDHSNMMQMQDGDNAGEGSHNGQ
ncbi:hypothetical protein SAMN05216296_2810 [Pseudomonas pohangensis]|uniref:Copper resistance protein B n=1 Tax=Pseudomonas pohangensis TaxID=364197 RepID=A0A1H2H7W8_9PSED|nr:hypothetical protein [Pseudomonas pohangensis]SDU27839.1 hypothetical protein SAMN05216296_2810 [Pseudomonas pohangensis]